MSALSRFGSIEEDAYQFLLAFCNRMPPSTVALVDEQGWLRLAPSGSHTAPVSLTVRNGDPTVVLGIGPSHDEVVLEWIADLDNYDSTWWLTNIEPVLRDVAAGQIKDATWNRGPGPRIAARYAPWVAAT